MIMVDTFKSKIAGRFKKASVVWVATPGALLGPGAARGAILPISPEPILDLSQAFTVQSLARWCSPSLPFNNFPGLLHPRRHRLLVELPQHKRHPRLERHSQFLQHWNTSGKSSSESKQPLLPELGQQGLGGDLGDDQHPNSWSRRGGFNCPPGEKDLKYFEFVSTRLKNCYNHQPRLNLRKISKRKRGRKGKVREYGRG